MLLTNSFEGGTNGATVTTGNSGGASGDNLAYVPPNPAPQPVYDNAHPAHGSIGVKLPVVTSQPCYVQFGGTGSGWGSTQFAFRFYVYFTALPSATFTLFRANDDASSLGIRYNIDNTGKLILGYGNGSTVTAWTAASAIPLNQSIRIEGRIDRSATAGRVVGAYYAADSTTPLETFTSANTLNTGTAAITAAAYGKYGTDTTATAYWIDDIAANTDTVTLIGPYVAVVNTPPTATIGTGTPALATQNDTVPLRGTVADTDGAATGAWTITAYPATLSGPPTITNPTSLTTASFPAVAAGDYTVRLTATDDAAATGSATKIITVSQAAATAPAELVWDGSTWR